MNNLYILTAKYLEYCKYRKGLNKKTLKAYKTDLTQYLDYLELISAIQDGLERSSVDSYITRLHTAFKPKSAKRKTASLKAFFRYLVYSEVIKNNPFDKIDTSFREPKLLPRTIPLHVIQAFLSTLYAQMNLARTEHQKRCLMRDIAVCELLFATGIRISELCSLSPGALDLKNGTVRIWGKGAKERILQLSHPDVLSALHIYQQEFAKEIGLCDYFFVNRLHRPLSDQSVRFMINKYAALANLNMHITPHMFRHSFATLLLEQDVDIRSIQKILGHSSITTTEIYTHVSNRRQKDLLEKKNPRNMIALE